MPASISIDVDALRFYGAIHGVDRDDPADDPIYRVALPRFFAMLEEAKVPATVFFIGEDIGRAPGLGAMLHRTRSELASHSHRHDYRLGTKPDADIEADLAAAHGALSAVAKAAGVGPVVGFRAPGYNTTPAMLRAALGLGYRYDSSLLPSPAYHLARAAAVAGYALRGRRSASMVGDRRAFAGPIWPYRTHPETPWRASLDGPLVELPIAVEPRTRLPLIGTSWVLLPPAIRQRWLGRALASATPFLFEMHAIDLIDATDPGVPPAIAAAQPDLRRRARDKIAALRSLFFTLADASEVLTLRELAARC